MFASKQIVVIGALLVGLGVTGSAVAASNQPSWETVACKGKDGWTTFTPKSEGDLPACHTEREWKTCKEEGREPLYAHWCPAKAGTGKQPTGFKPS